MIVYILLEADIEARGMGFCIPRPIKIVPTLKQAKKFKEKEPFYRDWQEIEMINDFDEV